MNVLKVITKCFLNVAAVSIVTLVPTCSQFELRFCIHSEVIHLQFSVS